jgi:hypothetical protein
MDEKSQNEELIDKLIKKRKLENEAFHKLLNAVNNKSTAQNEVEKTASKPKK